MRSTAGRIGFMSAVLMALAAPAFAADSASIEKQIAAAERAMNAAYAANDVAKYFSYYAEDMDAIFYGSRTNYADYLKSWTESVKAGNVVTSMKMNDVKVQVLPGGTAAVASYQIEVTYKHADGKSGTDKAFETDVWVMGKQGWKVQHAHYALAVQGAG
jgi:ketosteroid isomerase-like protein